MSPPPKEKRGLGTALKTAELPVEYYFLLGLQADASGREGARLFLEFWRTGNQEHLKAFVRYVTGKRARLVDGGSK